MLDFRKIDLSHKDHLEILIFHGDKMYFDQRVSLTPFEAKEVQKLFNGENAKVLTRDDISEAFYMAVGGGSLSKDIRATLDELFRDKSEIS